ncbi:MAG: PepSY-associated TM helix domain-containing protein [Pedobacter sp.]|nr:PepSY-associated TM helix domain-containing protein [Pedobacter sp.]
MSSTSGKRPLKARPFLLGIHRYAGLFIAIFLFISGLTGAIISWDHELDEALNPQLFKNSTPGSAQDPLLLATQLEKSDPRLRVSWMPLHVEPGHSLLLSVEPRMDPATGKAYALDFNQVALDPVTGAIQGSRFWGAISLSRENLLPFLYKLHYTMHIPDGFGLELGMIFMGIIAVVWVIDSFVALWISFPSRRVWKKSFAFRFRKGGHALNYDAHRSGGVWIWAILIVIAVTSVSLNLGQEVMRPVVSVFSELQETPFTSRTPRPFDEPLDPTQSREQVLADARTEATARGWTDPAGGIFLLQHVQCLRRGLLHTGK